MNAIMRPLTRARSCLVLVLLCIAGRQAAAEDLIEIRYADTHYRYADWLHTFRNSAVLDVFYDGVPGFNEFNFGGGYSFKLKKVTVTPLLYFVAGKEASQKGLRVAALVTFDVEGWKLISYLSHFVRLSGDVSRYQCLDTLDFTRVVAKRWEIGIQSGFFHYQGSWNPQNGPVVKLNDKYGAWALSYRFGPQRELRAARVFVF